MLPAVIATGVSPPVTASTPTNKTSPNGDANLPSLPSGSSKKLGSLERSNANTGQFSPSQSKVPGGQPRGCLLAVSQSCDVPLLFRFRWDSAVWSPAARQVRSSCCMTPCTGKHPYLACTWPSIRWASTVAVAGSAVEIVAWSVIQSPLRLSWSDFIMRSGMYGLRISFVSGLHRGSLSAAARKTLQDDMLLLPLRVA